MFAMSVVASWLLLIVLISPLWGVCWCLARRDQVMNIERRQYERLEDDY